MGLFSPGTRRLSSYLSIPSDSSFSRVVSPASLPPGECSFLQCTGSFNCGVLSSCFTAPPYSSSEEVTLGAGASPSRGNSCIFTLQLYCSSTLPVPHCFSSGELTSGSPGFALYSLGVMLEVQLSRNSVLFSDSGLSQYTCGLDLTQQGWSPVPCASSFPLFLAPLVGAWLRGMFRLLC